MNQICEQLFTGAWFTFNQNGGLRIGNAQREFDRATYRGRLADDAFLAVTLLQRCSQLHDLRRQLIALERCSDLIGDALD